MSYTPWDQLRDELQVCISRLRGPTKMAAASTFEFAQVAASAFEARNKNVRNDN